MKDENESDYSNFGILIPKGFGEPYVPPVYPEPKYKEGTKFKKWKLFDWVDTPPEQIEGNYLVDCEVTGKLYYNDSFGWIYQVKPSELVMNGDANWNRTMDDRTYTSDQELDKYFNGNN